MLVSLSTLVTVVLCERESMKGCSAAGRVAIVVYSMPYKHCCMLYRIKPASKQVLALASTLSFSH
jgi:hypothetical protein